MMLGFGLDRWPCELIKGVFVCLEYRIALYRIASEMRHVDTVALINIIIVKCNVWSRSDDS
jgi:hypothetical protein